jgi:ACR3 family arsenite transporter
MSIFERYLTLWVALCIVVGVALGYALPGLFNVIAMAEVAKVNLPVAVLVWLMIIPMLLKIDFGSLGNMRQHWRGVGVTLFINWAVKPFSMALLGAVFIGHLFAPLLPADQIPSYIAGLILLAAAPCTAMVFVWSNLCEGEPNYTLSQVALNDVIMVFAFAPLVGLLLGVASISVPSLYRGGGRVSLSSTSGFCNWAVSPFFITGSNCASSPFSSAGVHSGKAARQPRSMGWRPVALKGKPATSSVAVVWR